MEKVLIIHPKDNSTSFLEIVYKDIPNATLVTGGKSREEIKQLIEEHDRVMMMGHGSPAGLFAMGNWTGKTYGYIIDFEMVESLSKKDNSVFIWCNADRFVNRHQLKGFYSGMFISEVGEANYCGLPGTSQDIVDESNYGFVNIVSEHINKPQEEMYIEVRNQYGLLCEDNPVALYNFERLFLTI